MTFQAFDSFEEMQAAMAEAEAAANERTQPEQLAIAPGDYAIEFDPMSQLIILGKTLDEDTFVSLEMRAGSEEPEAAIRAHHQQMTSRNYLYGYWTSEVIPDEVAEFGSKHRSTMLPITEKQYQEAGLYGYNVHTLLTQCEWVRDALRLMQEIERRTRGDNDG